MVSQEVLKEKEAALAAFQEVRQKSQELQEYLEKESPKLVTAMVVVQKERDTASQAAAEATSSAIKAGGVLAEVLGSFNLEMAKARHINMQLQVLTTQYLVFQLQNLFRVMLEPPLYFPKSPKLVELLKCCSGGVGARAWACHRSHSRSTRPF